MKKLLDFIRNWRAKRNSIFSLATPAVSAYPVRSPRFVKFRREGHWQEFEATVTTELDMTDGEQIQASGIKFAHAHLAVIRQAFGRDAAAIYAQGMICAARDEMAADFGVRETYNKIAQIADDTLVATLPQGS